MNTLMSGNLPSASSQESAPPSFAEHGEAADPKKNNQKFRDVSLSLDGTVRSEFSLSSIQTHRPDLLPESLLKKFPPGLSKRSSFSLSSRGTLKDRFFLDVDYRKDDRDMGADEDSKLVLRYDGKKGEVLKSLELGDTQLELPGSNWLSLKGRTGKISRQSFAAKSAFAYRNLEMVLIAAQQKGKPEVEDFQLDRHAKQTAIRDTDYLQKRLFQAAPPENLPVQPDSLVLYYDDGNGFNNGPLAEKFVPEGGAEEGDYEILTPDPANRSGYEFNPQTGILYFFFAVPFNASLAVSYQSASGQKIRKRLIKSNRDNPTSELKNRYALPDDFLDALNLEVQDPSGNLSPAPDFSYDALKKLIVFTATQPFSADAYRSPPVHTYSLLLSYLSTAEFSAVTLSKEPIPETIKVELNGEPIKEGTGYTVSIAGGRATLNFYGTKSTDRVRVSYNSKDLPQIRQTLGSAILVGQNQPFTLGISSLYDFVPNRSEAPFLNSDPGSLQMLGLNLKGTQKFGQARFSLNLETANSKYNPNPYGLSIVENMNNIRRAARVQINETAWKPASRPPAVSGSRTRLPAYFGSVSLREIVPASRSDERENFLSISALSGEWSGLQTALSPGKGILDFRPYEVLELFVHSLNPEGTLNVEWGDLSEDSNGNGILESEDRNRDGQLNSGEDTGISLENGTAGQGNYLLDTEDLDLNGRLNLTESVQAESVQIGWRGWRRLRFPLKGIQGARFLRVWASGPANLQVARIELVGLEYSPETSAGSSLAIGSPGTFSDPDAPFLADQSAFRKLYRNPPDNQPQAEDFSMSLEYSLLPQGEALAKRRADLDLSSQNQIHFFAASTNTSNAVLFLRLGTKTDFFEYQVGVGFLSVQYREFSIHKDRFKTVGNPDWHNLSEIRIGVLNPGTRVESGKVYLNEIFVSDPVIEQATAYSVESEISCPFRLFSFKKGELLLKGSFLNVPKNFRVPGETLTGRQDQSFLAGWQSDGAGFRYSQNTQSQQSLYKGYRNVSAFFRSHRAEWTMTPAFFSGRTAISGNFEKIEQQRGFTERSENLDNRLEYSNDQLKDWFPKRSWVESAYKRDLWLSRKTVQTRAESRWTAFHRNLALSPEIAFDQTFSSDSAVIYDKSRLGFSGEILVPGRGGFETGPYNGNKSIPAFKDTPFRLEIRAYSESQIQRTGFPGLNLVKDLSSALTLSRPALGRTFISVHLNHSQVYTSSPAAYDSSSWRKHFASPSSDPDTSSVSREFSAAQEDIRLLRKFSKRDWVGLTLKSSYQQRRKSFLSSISHSRIARLPDGSLTVSTGIWRVTLAGWLEQEEGTANSRRTNFVSVESKISPKNWELTNRLSSRTETRSGISGSGTFHDPMARTETVSFQSGGKVNVVAGSLKTFAIAGRRLTFEKKLGIALDFEFEQNRGSEQEQKIEDSTLKILQRTDCSLNSNLTLYLSFDCWQKNNKISTGHNYLAYRFTAGIDATF